MKKHTHKYFRQKISDIYTIYKCILPGCTHYVQEKLVLGRNCICWRCGKEFVITKLHKKPHCDDCIKGRTKDVDRNLLEHFQQMLER